MDNLTHILPPGNPAPPCRDPLCELERIIDRLDDHAVALVKEKRPVPPAVTLAIAELTGWYVRARDASRGPTVAEQLARHARPHLTSGRTA